jgi:glycosyltransferase involved in cell wall biosynthesis
MTAQDQKVTMHDTLLVFNLRTDADDSVLGFTTSWINALAKRYANVVVITMHAGRLAVDDNVTVLSVGRERGYSKPRRALRFYSKMLWVMRRYRVQACFAHMMPLFAVMGAPLLKPRRVPTILWYTHGHVPLMLRLAVKTVDRVVTASPGSMRIDTPKRRVIGHGIDVARFAPASANEARLAEPDAPFIVLVMGRLSPTKRPDMVLNAVAGLDTDCRILIAGGPATASDKVYAAGLQDQVRRLGLQERVEFLGPVPFDQTPALYQRADCLVNLSRTNSVDKVVLEAMASGVLVLTSNTAFREILHAPLADTLTIDDTEDCNDLRDRLDYLAAIPDVDRRSLGWELRELVVREHSLENLVSQILNEFASIAFQKNNKIYSYT